MTSFKSILTEGPIPGVTHLFTYIGEWESFSGMHCEDQDLLSVNEIKGGREKIWYGVAARYANKLESALAGVLPGEYRNCSAFMRHKCVVVFPRFLYSQRIPFTKGVQQEGEIIVTFPRGYHQVFNFGPNVAVAVNFATKQWIPFGVKASWCLCDDRNQPLLKMGDYVFKHLGESAYDRFVQKKTYNQFNFCIFFHLEYGNA